MELTTKQEQGLKIAKERYLKREPYTVIAGYAGTGKSTLVKFIISALGLYPSQVAYVAYTGKAANVLAHKNCPNATTAHKLLYYSSPTKTGKYIYRPKPSSMLKNFKLIIVDEISMLPKTLWDLLLTHRIHVIACGDPEQLPPINEKEDNHVLDHPHIFLDQVMRQATESGIIRLSMDIREGREISKEQHDCPEVRIITQNEIVAGMYDWADQILVATNATRHGINNFIRSSKERGPTPEIGDKVICCHNQWSCKSTKENALVNGTIGNITSIQSFTTYLKCLDMYVPTYKVDIDVGESEEFFNMRLDAEPFASGKKTLMPADEYTAYKAKEPTPFEFNYGYAITCHRAQGSEWEKVVVVEESFPFSADEHRKWLYTACTRPSEKLILVKKD